MEATSLKTVPSLNFSFVESYIMRNCKSFGDSQMNKGFKYFSEGYVSEVGSILNPEKPTPPLVKTKLGNFPKGSVLSYQQRDDGNSIISVFQADRYPRLPLHLEHMQSTHVFTQEQHLKVDTVSQQEAWSLELSTRQQSQDPKRLRLRCHRISASRAREIFKKTRSIEEYVRKPKTEDKKMTEPMRMGILNEPLAATTYA